MDTNDEQYRAMITHLTDAQRQTGPLWIQTPSKKRTGKPQAERADNNLLPIVEQAIGNHLPAEEKAMVMNLLTDYGICKRMSENNYYSRSRDALKIIATIKGTNLRKGIDDAIVENGIKPLNHIVVKAAYFTMLALNHNMTEWMTNLETADLTSMIKASQHRTYTGNQSAILAYWDNDMAPPVRRKMREMMDFIIDKAVHAFNINRPADMRAIAREQLKLKAYAIMAIYLRDAGLIDSQYAAVVKARHNWVLTHPDNDTEPAAPAPNVPQPIAPAPNMPQSIAPNAPQSTAPAFNAPVPAPNVREPRVPRTLNSIEQMTAGAVQPIAGDDAADPTATKRAPDAIDDNLTKRRKSKDVFQAELDELRETCRKLRKNQERQRAELDNQRNDYRKLNNDYIDLRNEHNTLFRRCEMTAREHEEALNGMKEAMHYSKQALKIIRNLPEDEGIDAANYQNNVNAAINRGYRPGLATDPLFETKHIAQTAWNHLVFDNATETIGSPNGNRYPCVMEIRAGQRYAFVSAGPWTGFEKLITEPVTQPAAPIAQPVMQPAAPIPEPAAVPAPIEIQSSGDWSASDDD